MNVRNNKHYYASGILCLLLACCLGDKIQAQSAIPEKKIELSSQGKMISEQMERPEIDNTGSVNIQMPLYTLEVGDFKMPLSMGYNTGGIKVSQRPSIVGLGWNLMCGGVVQRSSRVPSREYTKAEQSRCAWHDCMGSIRRSCFFGDGSCRDMPDHEVRIRACPFPTRKLGRFARTRTGLSITPFVLAWPVLFREWHAKGVSICR